MKHQTKKTCMNPSCKKVFVPGHYGPLQVVCGSSTLEKCVGKSGCAGTGKTLNGKCLRCAGTGKVKQTCKEWYQGYWASVRKPPRGIPEDQLEKILKAIEKDLFWYSLIMVASRSGMRKGELLGLTWGDVMNGDEVRASFNLRGQWDDQTGSFRATKTGSGRTAYLLDDAKAALGRWRKEAAKAGSKGPDRVWNVSESTVWSWFTTLQRRLKVANPETGRPYRFHDCRHYAAVSTYRVTGELHRATVLLGHKSPATTMIYAAERPEDYLATLEKAFGKAKRKP